MVCFRAVGAPGDHPQYPQRVRDVGADVITANTLRAHDRNLQHTEYAHQAFELTRIAVELARQAAGNGALVAGSQSPLEDCYSPELGPGDVELNREHQAMSRHLADAGVDLILVETQNTIREAAVATRAAASTGLPVFVSFVCNRQGRLLSGEIPVSGGGCGWRMVAGRGPRKLSAGRCGPESAA